MSTPKSRLAFCLFTLALVVCAGAGQTNAPLDLSRGRTLYTIGYSHLDTEWRWGYPQVVREFLPNTVHDNVPLFEKYPDYVFNWSGANRYRLMQEYCPDDFATVREWVAKGRWFPAGTSWEENDVNVPSPESLIRQILFGHEYFMKEFGTESSEFMLPDCFGFPASLPSVLAHCGVRGFSTQKLTWHPVVDIPFNVGVWVGPDGNSVIAALNPGSYGTRIGTDLALSEKWKTRLDQDGAKSGVYADYMYYGVGDRGGAPDEGSVEWIQKSVTSTGAMRVISARADQMFNDISDSQEKHLPKYQGDLLLTQHSAGSITSEGYMKRWNRENELLANEAESAAIAADLLGAAPYPREKLHHAWELVLTCQFHDMLPGTSLPKVYEYCWNDEVIAMNSFAEVLRNSVGAVATGLDTRADGTPLVIYNPLSIGREDVTEAELEFAAPPSGVQVLDGNGKPVPAQLLSTDGNKARFLFIAKAPPVGFAVYSVKQSDAPAAASPLKVGERSLENNRYRVTLNDAGDIASVFDKPAKRELLSAPARLDFQTEHPDHHPAWNMDWTDQKNPPRDYVGGPAKFRVVERGPVRVAVEVEREAENSIFTQTISLAAGAAGDRVEIANHVDWQSKTCALKAEFPLTVSNPLATYNWDLGKIQRGNNNPREYEVPSHQWFDLTDKNGKYGVSILNDAKYGSDKPADNLLRLTLLYTPGVENAPSNDRYSEQKTQDWGRHDFVYGIYGHAGDWRAAKSDWQSLRMNQPLLAFKTAPHEGKLGKSYSLLQVGSDQVAVRTIKLAEDGHQVIVRLQELNGKKNGGVKLEAAGGIENAIEVSGIEKNLNPLRVSGGQLKLAFAPYQLRSLSLTLTPPARLSPPVCVPVELPYNLNAFSARGAEHHGNFDGAGSTIPAEMIDGTVVAEDIRFQIGPRGRDDQNAVSCQGQAISLPAGPRNELYLLAESVNGDADGTFAVDGRPTALHIQNWTGYIGQWDNRNFEGTVPELSYDVTNRLAGIASGYIKRDPLAWFCSHRRLADGSDAVYSYSYLFKYRIPLPPGARTLTLPNNPDIRILAASVAQNNNDATQPIRPLYDDFNGRQPVVLRDGWDTFVKY
ncbi:MAG: glycoside hydrolase family 38 C-terminal domain-containing protein [Verrucomicrobiota bacterium]